MAQLSLVESVFTPVEMQVNLSALLTANEPTTSMTIVAYGRLRHAVASGTTRWTGVQPDLLPDAVQAAVEAYLYASQIRDIPQAVNRVHSAALRHDKAHRER